MLRIATLALVCAAGLWAVPAGAQAVGKAGSDETIQTGTPVPAEGTATVGTKEPDGTSDTGTVSPDGVTRPSAVTEVPSFQRRGATRAGGPANELNTNDARERAAPPGGSEADAISGRALYHGSFCGLGDRGPGATPVDKLDEACQAHDRCYDQAGRRSCQCDRQLRVAALAAANATELSREVRRRAASVAQAAELMQCVEP